MVEYAHVLERLVFYLRERQICSDTLAVHCYVTKYGVLPFTVTLLDVFVALQQLGYHDRLHDTERFYRDLTHPIKRDVYNAFMAEEQERLLMDIDNALASEQEYQRCREQEQYDEEQDGQYEEQYDDPYDRDSAEDYSLLEFVDAAEQLQETLSDPFVDTLVGSLADTLAEPMDLLSAQ